MQVRSIQLDDEGLPSSMTVEMSVAEASAIAEWAGQLNPSTPTTSDIFFGLSDELFNRFWDDGRDGYARGDKS